MSLTSQIITAEFPDLDKVEACRGKDSYQRISSLYKR